MKLVIAEKPSVAMSIARVIGANDKSDGYCTGNGYIVTWCVGHLVSSAPPEEYDSAYAERTLSSLPILPRPYHYIVYKETKAQFDIVKRLMFRDDVISLVCATDAGREGELIFRLVYNQAECHKPFERLWISSMEEKAIRNGFDNLKPGSDYDDLYMAALSRLQADWYVGINFSRLFSNIYNSKLPVGRVQTTIVNMIVQRQLEINNFKSVPYYVLEADCGDFKAKSEKYTKKEAAEAIRNVCEGQPGKIIKFEQKQRKELPPTLFDLTSLQREANKRYGYTAQQVLDIIQHLYEEQLLTYPRTDSKYITEDMCDSTARLIRNLLLSPLTSAEVKQQYNLEFADVQKCANNSKVSDHHAIIPTETLLNKDISDLSKQARNCLDLVISRTLMAVYKPCAYNETTVILDVAGKEFTAKGKVIIEPGFKQLERSEDNGETESSLSPSIALDKIYDSVSVSVIEKQTTPPQPFDDNSLLSAMENARKQTDIEEYKSVLKECKGIGTPATRASIIEKIVKSGYVERKKKVFVPTKKAFSLIEVVPDEVKSVELTAHWEQQLDLISHGKMSSDNFMSEIFDYIKSVVQNGKANAGTADTEKFKPTYEVIGICPRCGKNILNYPKTYACESGRDGCGFVIFKDNKWWTEKKKTLSSSLVSKLLKNGKVKVKGLYSEKKDKKYDATVEMVDTGKYVNFKLLF